MDENSTPEVYQYEELPSEESFRIVELLPGKDDESLFCLLHTILDWSNLPEYEAISYTWGDPNNKSSLFCHGLPHEVPTNLHEALKHLRLPDRSRTFWADALCTNQFNIPERGDQVNQMRRIYKSAKRVLIWLGPDTPNKNAKIAFDLVRKFTDFICGKLDMTLSKLRNIDDVYEKVILKNRHKLPHPDRCGFVTEASWEPLRWLYSCRYFTRGWVIQEINANDMRLVNSGNETIDWESIHLVAAYFIMETAWSKNFGFSTSYCWWVSTVSGELRHHGKNWLHMLYLASNFSCTDSRDNIYSLRGMIEVSKGDDLLRPDYEHDVLHVYRNLVEASLLNFENTDVLLYNTIQSNGPSWIPQWNQAMLFRNPFRFGKGLPWRPAGSTKPEWAIERERNLLLLKGFMVDTVAFSEPYDESYFGNTLLHSTTGRNTLSKHWKRILKAMEDSLSQLPIPKHCLQAAAQAFSFGLNETADPADENHLLMNFAAYLGAILDNETYAKYVPHDLRRDSAKSDGHAFGKPVWDFEYPESTFFITKNKFFGCTTSKNTSGDLVFVPLGSTFPLILSPRSSDGTDGKKEYLIRGFAWVPGVMLGEMQESAIEEITIC